MKLVYCQKCGDIFNLCTDREKSCSCGTVSGKYTDNSHAEVSGEHIALAIGNGSFTRAAASVLVKRDTVSDWRYDERRGRVVALYEQMRELVPGIMLAWARPATGATNAHTSSRSYDDSSWHTLVAAGRTVAAIKQCRVVRGISLKDAHRIVHVYKAEQERKS